MSRSLGAFLPYCRRFAQLKADSAVRIARCAGVRICTPGPGAISGADGHHTGVARTSIWPGPALYRAGHCCINNTREENLIRSTSTTKSGWRTELSVRLVAASDAEADWPVRFQRHVLQQRGCCIRR